MQFLIRTVDTCKISTSSNKSLDQQLTEMLRRVKSFSSRSHKSKSPPRPATPAVSPKPVQDRLSIFRRKPKLEKRISVSLDCVPLHVDIETNDLFNKQKVKLRSEHDNEPDKSRQEPKRRVTTTVIDNKSLRNDEITWGAPPRSPQTRNQKIATTKSDHSIVERKREIGGTSRSLPPQSPKRRVTLGERTKNSIENDVTPQRFLRQYVSELLPRSPKRTVSTSRVNYNSSFKHPDKGSEVGGQPLRTPQFSRKVSKDLERRKSMSLDENNFGRYCWSGGGKSEVPYYPVNYRNPYGSGRVPREPDRIRTVDVLNDLITNLEGQGDDVPETGNNPLNFPIIEENDQSGAHVEVRQKLSPAPLRLSKTVNYDTPKQTARKRGGKFETRGVTKITVGREAATETSTADRICYNDNKIAVVGADDRTKFLKDHVDLKRGTRLLNKRDVLMRDTSETPYVFQFESSKDAKQFVDLERTRSNSFSEKTTIKTKLLRLLGKRSSRDLLESKGILRNEPIFGNTLTDIYNATHGIPLFMIKVIELIETPANIRSVGLYRTSGNLAVIQKIRCEVDNGRLNILEEHSQDVDVLTGSLKLFFRELKQEIVDFEVSQRILEVIDKPNSMEMTKKILDNLPKPNQEILSYLMKHLVKVYENREYNKMDIYNLSVCWGPSVIGIPEACTDIVVQTSNISKVMEHLINFYKTQLSEANNRNSQNGSLLPGRKVLRKQSSEDSISSSQVKSLIVEVQDKLFELVKRITEIVEVNINTEGIYRKSGSKENIKKVLQKIVDNRLEELDGPSQVHDVCCALKKYLANLPHPLIPQEMFDQYCSDCDTLDFHAVKKNVQSYLGVVPQSDTLLLLVRHLKNVVRHDKNNKMSLASLTEIWAVTLMSGKDKESKDKIKKFCKLLEVLMELGEVTSPSLRARESRYDNVPEPDSISGGTNSLEEETESVRL